MNDINAPAPPLFGIGDAVKFLKEGKRVKVRGATEGGFFMLSKPNAHGEQILMERRRCLWPRHGMAWERADHLYTESVLCGHWELLEGEWEPPDYPANPGTN